MDHNDDQRSTSGSESKIPHHNTSTPEQAQTDTYEVRGTGVVRPDEVEVPKYTAPDAGAEEMDEWDRMELAAFLSDVAGQYARVRKKDDHSDFSTVHVHDNHPTFRAIEEAHDL